MDWPRVAGALLGLYALVGGVLSFTGWVFNLPRLTDWYNNGISIQPNTCIAVMAAGSGLIFLNFGYRRVAACLRSARRAHWRDGRLPVPDWHQSWHRYALDVRSHLGTPWCSYSRPDGSPRLVVMDDNRLHSLFDSISGTPEAPGPAFKLRPLIPVLALLTTTISTLSIIGYIYGASVLYTVPTLTVIALQTATFILAISLGLLTTVTERGPMRLINDDSPAGLITRRVVPAIIALPVLVGFLRLTGERAGLYDTAFGSALRTVIEIGLFLLLMGWTGNAISRQARRLELQRAELLEREHELRTVAEASSKLKDEFLATLSHELRNPLNVVLGYSELLLRTPQIADTPHLLQISKALKRNAQSQSQLINDLLDLSRLQMGKVSLNREIVSLGTILDNAVETVRADATAKNITISVTSPDELFVVDADPLRMQQVVWNLLNNAVKFTPDGGAISLSLQSENGAVLLTIQDSGPGIDPEFLPHVFEMFRQADSSSVRRHGGMGIGLALVHQLIQLHEGSVSVASDGPGHGAKFTDSPTSAPAKRFVRGCDVESKAGTYRHGCACYRRFRGHDRDAATVVGDQWC